MTLPGLTDPSDALTSFQQALLNGEVQLQRGELDTDIFVHLDRPAGSPRFTYARVDRKTVTAPVILVCVDPIDGVPCFQIGYAVPPTHRNKGRAKDAPRSPSFGMGCQGTRCPRSTSKRSSAATNEASQRIAAATLSDAPTEVTDSVSGLPALHYVRKLGG
jgi:hypothetical protein